MQRSARNNYAQWVYELVQYESMVFVTSLAESGWDNTPRRFFALTPYKGSALSRVILLCAPIYDHVITLD